MDAGQKIANPPLYRYRFGTAEFDEARFDLRVGGLTVELEPRPLEVLACLLHHPDEVVTRDELIQAVWNGRLTLESTLAAAILKLRLALGEANARRIHAQTRGGYRLEGPVQRNPIGRTGARRLALKARDPVPGQPAWILDRLLARSQANAHPHETWIAQHAKTQAQRVFKFTTDGTSVASLRREASVAQALRESLGEREDLVPVLDWNLEQPPYFLECDYGGENLASWAAIDHRLADMSMEERIALFLQIADAVAAAHGAGILHTDLKPGNVLVSGRPGSWQVRLTGFGISHLLEPGRLAQLGITMPGLASIGAPDAGALPGETPMYLAPELIAGRAPTVQSDVFALGMLLYQLLAGDFGRPMASGWEGDVTDDLVREDLVQATDGTPMRRFAGAAEFARRLRRREQRRAERVRERHAALTAREALLVLERHRVRRPLAIATLVVLAVAAGASLWGYRRAEAARETAVREAARNQAVNRFLADDLLGASDATAPGTVGDPGLREVLRRAGARVDRRFADDPLALATLHLELGGAWSSLADPEAAAEHDRRAIALLTEARGATDPATLDGKYRLATALALAGNVEEAESLLDATDGEAGNRLRAPSPLALVARWARATLMRVQHHDEETLANLQAAEQLRRAVAPRDDAWTLRILDALGDCLLRLGRAGDAREALAPLLEDDWTPERIGPVRWSTLRLRYGAILAASQRLDEAQALTQAAIQRLEQTVGPDDSLVGVALGQLADLEGQRGRWNDALEPARRADAIARARLGETSQAALLSRVRLGAIEFQVGRYPQAVEDLRNGRDGLSGLLGAQSPPAQGAAFFLASTLTEIGRHEEAWSLADSLEPAALATALSGDGWTPRLSALKGQIRLRQGRRTEAAAILEPAVQEMEKAGVPASILDAYRKSLAQAKGAP